MKIGVCALLLGLVLAACGDSTDSKEDNSALYDAARQPLDKAEAVEDVILESKDRLDEAVDEADGG